MTTTTALAYVLACAAASVAGQILDGQTLDDAIVGVPGQDFPIYAEVPDTGFACGGRINGGYYSDPQAQCQVFHVCSNDIRYSFLCPNGTLFSQLYFVCDWWYNFDCTFAEQLYALNEQLFTDAEFDGRAFAERLGIVVGSGSQRSSVVASAVRGVDGVNGVDGLIAGQFGSGVDGLTAGQLGSGAAGLPTGQSSVFRNVQSSAGSRMGAGGGVATGYGAPGGGRK